MEQKNNDYHLEIDESVVIEVFNLDEKVQDDLDLIALVEGNPRLYDKRKNDYKNVKDRDMAWESIGNALAKQMSGPDAKHRWETLRNLYGRARRQLTSLEKENSLSGSGQNEIIINDILTPQSKAIHRFLGKLYVPRKTTSNYVRPRKISVPVSKSTATLDGLNQTLAPSTSASVLVPTTLTNAKLNKLLTTQTQKASTVHMKEKTEIISQMASMNSFLETPDLSSSESTSTVSLCNEDLTNYKSESESTSEVDDKEFKAKQVFAVPKKDIRKRKKGYDDAEVALLESTKAINSMCCELPKLLQSTNTVTQVTDDDMEENKAMVTVILQSFKQVPKKKRSRCMIKIFEVIQSFEEDTV